MVLAATRERGRYGALVQPHGGQDRRTAGPSPGSVPGQPGLVEQLAERLAQAGLALPRR